MQTVNHKIFGIGEVIGREEREDGTRISVRFKNEKVVPLKIPESFMVGVVDAEGSLKDEVDMAIAAKLVREKERLNKLTAAPVVVPVAKPSRKHGRRPKASAPVKCAVQSDYEAYLISADYKTKTPSGHDSTVYAYSKAIANHVLKNEHMTWEGLRGNIADIVTKYDVGGAMEHVGAKSNNTVIDALKRFQEFVNP